MKTILLIGFLVFSMAILINVAHANIDSVIAESPDYNLEVSTKVTSPDDCYGTQDGSNWIWVDGECILEDPPSDYKVVPRKYLFASPLKQIKSGVALVDIQCNDGKHVVYKRDRMRAACVTDEAEGKLLKRGWAALRLGLPATDDLGRDLCIRFEGEWNNLSRNCHGLKYPLLCSMSGGDIIDSTCFIPSTTGVAPHNETNEKTIELFKDLPEVKAFYAKYPDANVSARDDHVSFFAGSEDDFHVRMNLFFDENYELDHIDFHCYFQNEHQFEFPQEDIVSKLERYDCNKSGI